MTKMIKIFVDGIELERPAGTTIMQAADSVGAHVPRLCYHPSVSTEGSCRVCIVEVEGQRNYSPACSTAISEGMKIKTNSPDLFQSRRDLIELIIDNHPKACLTCERDGNCELQNLAYTHGVRERLFEGERKRHPIESSSKSVVRDAEKCILCRRCVRVCSEVQAVHNLTQLSRGFKTVVAPAFNDNMADSVCINCGQCINVCPTAALSEKKSTDHVWNALKDPTKHVVVQVAPAIRAAIGEGFGLEAGTPCTGKLAAALRRLGFDAVFDTDFTADLTIIEESHEFIQRLTKGAGPLPMITSCSPGWVKYLEHFYPELIPNTSSCKSPMSMMSTLIKTYYAEQKKIDPKNIVNVAIMPCTAKKFEADREELRNADGDQYTDYVLTTRELIWMIKSYGITFTKLADEEFDAPLGESSGAGVIFAATGGVMEAALRTAAEKITGKEVAPDAFQTVRHSEGVKDITLNVAGTDVHLCVVNGLNNAKTVLDEMKAGKSKYHLVEIMACPGGCISGGGQPMMDVHGQEALALDPAIIKARTKAIYDIDAGMKLRKSHENESILKLYKNYLGEVGGHKAHDLLHTHYVPRSPKGIN